MQLKEAGPAKVPTVPVLRKFESGAVRDADADDTRYDLVAPEGMRRLAETYAEGAKKYDDHNWRKGMPFSATANHAIRHVYKWLAGLTDEDHLAHAAWGLFALMEFEKTHADLDDRYFKPKPLPIALDPDSRGWVHREDFPTKTQRIFNTSEAVQMAADLGIKNFHQQFRPYGGVADYIYQPEPSESTTTFAEEEMTA